MKKRSYHIVQKDLEKKKDVHGKWMMISISLMAFVSALIGGILFYNYSTKNYIAYDVLESIPRTDAVGTKFQMFADHFLKYSNDGMFCMNIDNNLVWNQSYEMQNPIVDICENYAAVADKKGKIVYIMDTTGPLTEIQTTKPIRQLHVANQGMVAVLMEEHGAGYIHLYDKEGNSLAEGELHAKNSGYPLDLDISNDGRKMIVTMLDVNQGIIKTNVAFYNFGPVGQNEIDNIVCSYPYEETIVAKVQFLTNDLAVAVSDHGVIFYEGVQKPAVAGEIVVEQEIRSVFYNKNYIGLVFQSEKKETSYHLKLYSVNGELVNEFDIPMEYEEIEFLSNGEICIRNNTECSIYTVGGMRRFYYHFKEEIQKVIHRAGRRYLFFMSDATEEIRLR